MNIEQFRAMKAQISEETLKEEQTQTEETETKTIEAETKTDTEGQTQEENKLPGTIELEIDGQKVEVPFDELKNGYLRQSDYTKKTQEVSKKSKELEDAVVLYEYLKANPQIAKQIVEGSSGAPQTNSLDPVSAKILELENTMANMMIENEVSRLSTKFKDFDAMAVMNVAKEKEISNLEDAYYIWKQGKGGTGAPDMETLKQQIRDDILKEIENERGTDTIIKAKGTPATNAVTRELSPAEKKVARNMNLTESEYKKWKNV